MGFRLLILTSKSRLWEIYISNDLNIQYLPTNFCIILNFLLRFSNSFPSNWMLCKWNNLPSRFYAFCIRIQSKLRNGCIVQFTEWEADQWRNSICCGSTNLQVDTFNNIQTDRATFRGNLNLLTFRFAWEGTPPRGWCGCPGGRPGRWWCGAAVPALPGNQHPPRTAGIQVSLYYKRLIRCFFANKWDLRKVLAKYFTGL